MVCTARLPVREPQPQTHPGRRERGPPGREGEKEEGGGEREGRWKGRKMEGREGDHQLYPHPLHLHFSLGSLPSPLSPSSPITLLPSFLYLSSPPSPPSPRRMSPVEGRSASLRGLETVPAARCSAGEGEGRERREGREGGEGWVEGGTEGGRERERVRE